jgi:hypothetical protein
VTKILKQRTLVDEKAGGHTMSLGEQIAVLDGLAAMDPNDGRTGQVRARANQYGSVLFGRNGIEGLGQMKPNDGRTGQVRARVDQYGRPTKVPNFLVKTHMPSTDGALYGGGSSYYPGGALMPSSVGLAQIPSVLPGAVNVISPSGGVNHGGGSSYADSLPLLPSNSGLVGFGYPFIQGGYGRAGLGHPLIQGGYGRAGLGHPLIQGGYGRAGLGQTLSAADEDLAQAAETAEHTRMMNPDDGRTGQHRSRVDEYGQPIVPGVLDRSNVLDPSEGANYGGGSDYYAGSPLLPSSVGLAELQTYDGLDGLALPLPVSKAVVNSLKSKAMSVAKRLNNMNPRQKAMAAQQLNVLGRQLFAARSMRRQAAQAAGVPVARVPRNRYAVRMPQWAQ